MKKKSAVMILAAGLALGIGPAWADDVTDTIEQALKSYQAGNYSEAADNLNYALQMVNQKKSGVLGNYLPPPLEGWSAGEVQSASGAAVLGAGISASRNYTKGESEIDISIVADSPLLQGMLVMFSNPMFAASDGGRLTRIKGQKAIVKYRAKDREGEIQIVVANRFLVTIKGQSVSLDEMKAYANAIDYKKIAALP